MDMMMTTVNELEERIIELERRLGEHTGGKPEEGFPEYMDKTSAAKAIGVTRATVYKMIEDGRTDSRGLAAEQLQKQNNGIVTCILSCRVKDEDRKVSLD